MATRVDKIRKTIHMMAAMPTRDREDAMQQRSQRGGIDLFILSSRTVASPSKCL
jgi:hypothetical protein